MNMSPEKAVRFLTQAAGYFRSRPTNGEDRAFWANTYNAENCEAIAELVRKTYKLDEVATKSEAPANE